jgi:hypothetical protein
MAEYGIKDDGYVYAQGTRVFAFFARFLADALFGPAPNVPTSP